MGEVNRADTSDSGGSLMDPTQPPSHSPPFDSDSPFSAATSPDAKKFAHEKSGDAQSEISIITNRSQILLAKTCQCSLYDDIIAHSESCAFTIGTTPGRAVSLAYISLVLDALPRLAYVLEYRAHLALEHLKVLARAVTPLLEATPELLDQMEPKFLAAMLPRIDNQKMITDRTLHGRLQAIIEDYDEMLRPPGLDEHNESRERITVTDDGHSTGFVSATMDRDKSAEISAAITAVKAKEDCTDVDALLHLVRGSTSVDVTLNLYCHLNGGPIWSVETGWLEGLAAQKWLDRVNSIRIISDSAASGYRPTEAQSAFVKGRDGTCMFPGCDIGADTCQLDHITPYDHDNPESGGPTDTENLHALCQRHHNLKTDGLFEVIRFSDGTEKWTSTKTGATATSESTGPANGPGRVSVSARIRRRTQTVRNHNADRLRKRADPRPQRARPGYYPYSEGWYPPVHSQTRRHTEGPPRPPVPTCPRTTSHVEARAKEAIADIYG